MVTVLLGCKMYGREVAVEGLPGSTWVAALGVHAGDTRVMVVQCESRLLRGDQTLAEAGVQSSGGAVDVWTGRIGGVLLAQGREGNGGTEEEHPLDPTRGQPLATTQVIMCVRVRVGVYVCARAYVRVCVLVGRKSGFWRLAGWQWVQTCFCLCD
jgi:hypothetical protein